MARKVKPLFTTSEWDFNTIKKVYSEIEKIAVEELKLDTYPNQIEIITSEQMLDAYASLGLPIMYRHWSFGKRFIQNEAPYKAGLMGLAYEIVSNTNPVINYLMEENTMTMQTLVIAHAAFGHNHFFKNSELFRDWTDAEGIIDYLVFARNYIDRMEEKHGYTAVEEILDSCHALMEQGIDKYQRPPKLSPKEEEKRQQERSDALQHEVNDLWRTLPTQEKTDDAAKERFPKQPEENLLYFIEKTSPILEPWQREIVRIIRKIAQYFYPQMQSQIMNEGFATFTHYYIMNRLYEKGLITDGSMQEFLHSHTNVVFQPSYNSKFYDGINPYALGFSMMMDIKRICENPTEEDKEWFPDIAGTPWLDTIHHAVQDYRDSSFIRQFLSPKLIRDMHLFDVADFEREETLIVKNIHNERGYRNIRKALADLYDINFAKPDIQVWNVDMKGDRKLYLRHNIHNGVKLGPYTDEVLKHIRRLWGFGVQLESIDSQTNETVQIIDLNSTR